MYRSVVAQVKFYMAQLFQTRDTSKTKKVVLNNFSRYCIILIYPSIGNFIMLVQRLDTKCGVQMETHFTREENIWAQTYSEFVWK